MGALPYVCSPKEHNPSIRPALRHQGAMEEGNGDGAMAGEGDVRFDPWNTPRPTPRGLDVATTLRHFALVTYAVEPAQIQAYVAPPFRPVTVETAAGPRAQDPGMALELPGFPDVETGLLYLTHALVGYYRQIGRAHV